MSDNASQFVGNIPKFYDEDLGPVIFDAYAGDLAERIAELEPKTILELAAGTGIASRKIADAVGNAARLTVTDLNAPMLEIAREKIGPQPNVEFTVMDAMSLDASDSSFDVVASQFGVMFFPDKVAAFKEVKRVLKNKGTYVFNVWGNMEENQFAQIAYEAGAHFFEGDPPGFYNVPFSYSNVEEIRTHMFAAGFSHFDHHHLPLNTKVRSWADFARGIIFGNPMIGEIEARGNIDPDEVKSFVEKRFEERWGPSPTTMPIKATIIKARA